MRTRRLSALFLVIFIAGTFVYYLRQNVLQQAASSASGDASHGRGDRQQQQEGEHKDEDASRHPLTALVDRAEHQFHGMVERQSKTLADAVKEYRRRYGIAPPPRFDQWFRFAQKHAVQVIDDYDTIYDSLLPFWGLRPATIRARVREALGFDDNALVAILIRNGKVSHHQAGPAWQQNDTVTMLQEFIHLLPDMDVAFNIYDEPRVVIPHDELSQLVAAGLATRKASGSGKQKKKNEFTMHAADWSDGRRVEEYKTTRFNIMGRQAIWLPSRLSCDAKSPARSVEDDAQDDTRSYGLGPLNFIRNRTAFTDVCNTPSLSHSHGFFDRPASFSLTHSLIPIFSQSKPSSFQDILYPSPWYWDAKKIQFDASKDVDWAEKKSDLFWVGSTTGGYSKSGSWRRQHRQRMVMRLNAKDKATVLHDRGAIEAEDHAAGKHVWATKEVDRTDLSELVNVHFSHIGQCEKADCRAQKEYFDLADRVDFQDNWQHKLLLDMDGNAFSGRFYAFLKSKSLPVKMSIFREWHEEWIQPWAHYVPIGLKGDEVLESVRYLTSDDEGKQIAERLALQGRDWANKTLRNVDLEAWLFRLMLEYARVIDDDRDNLGFEM